MNVSGKRKIVALMGRRNKWLWPGTEMIMMGSRKIQNIYYGPEFLTKDFEENKTKIIISLLSSCKMQVKSKLCSYISQSDASGVAAPPTVPGVAKYLHLKPVLQTSLWFVIFTKGSTNQRQLKNTKTGFAKPYLQEKACKHPCRGKLFPASLQ